MLQTILFPSEYPSQIYERFSVNNSFLEVTKTYFTLFHKKFTIYDIALKMSELNRSNSIIKKKSSVVFLGLMLDDNKSW